MTRPSALGDPPPTDGQLLPIREVVQLTGVNPVTLRAWERRYGLIQPVRTAGGHRLYSPQEVETIRAIMNWTERGVPVSKVGALLAHARRTDTSSTVQGVAGAGESGRGKAEWEEWRDSFRQALSIFDQAGLDQLYGQLFSIYRTSELFSQVLMPVWRESLRKTSFGHMSQWLFYDAFLRGRVLQRLQFARRNVDGCVLLAALPEQCYELELLVTGLMLSDDDCAVCTLSPGQPLDELPLLCQAIQPHALVLFAPSPPSMGLLRHVGRLVLAIDCPLAMAGVGAELVEETLEGSPVASLGSEPELMLSRLKRFQAGFLET